MPKILALLLTFVLGALMSLGLEIFIFKDWKLEDEERKAKGCHCPTFLWFFIIPSPECPVHGEYSVIQSIRNVKGEAYANFPYVSPDRVPVCNKCLEKHIQQDFDMYYYRKVVGTQNDKEWPNGCVMCGASTLCAMVPKNIIDDWAEGRLFHFSWKDDKNDKRRKEGSDPPRV